MKRRSSSRISNKSTEEVPPAVSKTVSSGDKTPTVTPRKEKRPITIDSDAAKFTSPIRGRRSAAAATASSSKNSSGDVKPSKIGDVDTTATTFKFTNDVCLQLYKEMRTFDEFSESFEKSEYEKFIRGALKANNGPLQCMVCQKELSTAMGMVLHLNARKCAAPKVKPQLEDSPEKSQTKSQDLPNPILKQGRKFVEITSAAELEKEPSRWFKITDSQKENTLLKFYGAGPYPCFSIPMDDEPKTCQPMATTKEAIKHLNTCVKHMYFTFKGSRIAQFRALDQKTKARWVREAQAACWDGHLQCLECERKFNHHYGLIYHVDRCNVDDSIRPWKCYRCGFHTTVSNSDAHLNLCWAGDNTNDKMNNAEKEDSPLVMGTLGDVNLRSGKTVVKGHGGSIAIGGVEKDINKVNAHEIISELIKKESEIRGGRKKRYFRASISTGYIPMESSRVRISAAGQLRFRFRKAEISDNLTALSDLSSYGVYASSVLASSQEWEIESRQLKLCERLQKLKSQCWNNITEIPSVPHFNPDKESINFRLRNNILPQSLPVGAFPISCSRIRALTTKSLSTEEDVQGTPVAYVGGPIHTIKMAPNPLSEHEHVFAVGYYPCDETLTGPDWKEASGVVQLWIMRQDTETKRPELIPWFLLRSTNGLIMSLTWLDRIRPEGDDTLIGHLALATAQGNVLIYRIDVSSVSLPGPTVAGEQPDVPMVCPEPDVILSQPAFSSKEKQEADTTMDDGGDVTMTEEKHQPLHSPPLIKVTWCGSDCAQYVAGLSATGAVVFWDMSVSVTDPKYLRDQKWASPANDICFAKEFDLAVAFREKNVRVFDIRSWACVLEEGTVRTAGARVSSEPRAFAGVLTYQSEYFVGGNIPCTGAAYISCDPHSQGYFVVPLANRHSMQTWDIAISPLNGVTASVGVDGKLMMSTNGHVASRLSKADAPFSVMRASLQLIRNRVARDTELNEKGEPKLADSYVKTEDVAANLWLDVSLRPTKNAKDAEYASLDSRIESLNAIATTKHGVPYVVCGGQAGLLFCRPCTIDSDGSVVDPAEWLSSLLPNPNFRPKPKKGKTV